jgi:hypothetical protein
MLPAVRGFPAALQGARVRPFELVRNGPAMRARARASLVGAVLLGSNSTAQCGSGQMIRMISTSTTGSCERASRPLQPI